MQAILALTAAASLRFEHLASATFDHGSAHATGHKPQSDDLANPSFSLRGLVPLCYATARRCLPGLTAFHVSRLRTHRCTRSAFVGRVVICAHPRRGAHISDAIPHISFPVTLWLTCKARVRTRREPVSAVPNRIIMQRRTPSAARLPGARVLDERSSGSRVSVPYWQPSILVSPVGRKLLARIVICRFPCSGTSLSAYLSASGVKTLKTRRMMSPVVDLGAMNLGGGGRGGRWPVQDRPI